MAPSPTPAWRDAWLDLVLGSRCAGCGRPGRALCGPCEASLPRSAAAAWPTPTPPGLVRPSAAGEYAGVLRALVLAHKEQGRLALDRPLGRLLALAVLEGWGAARGPGWPVEVALVPVPSHPAVVRERGHDPVLRMTRQAARELRRQGAAASVRPVLRVRHRPADQAGLSASERARNVEGRFAVRPRVRAPRSPVVLVDDVVTTGVTLREAQRALHELGVRPLAAATVAATRRRSPPRLPVSAPGH